MRRFWLVVLSLVLLLAACSKSPNVALPEIEGIFSDEDIDKATLSLATQTEAALGTQESEISGITQGKTLPNSNADIKSDFTAQAILPNTGGFLYVIRFENSNWIVDRYNQASGSLSTMYGGKREVQSIGGSGDGKTIVVSMRESTSLTSDFEIYRFNLDIGTVQRLSNNAVDDTNVSLSADAKTVVWQTSVSGVSSILFRVYSASSTFTQKKLAYPTPAREPSLSGDGKFITYIHDRTNGLDQLWKYDLSNNVYTAIYSTPDASAVLKHPSISNDGNRIMYLMIYPTNQDIQYIDLVANTRLSAGYSTSTLEHPFITADGKYLTYGYSGQIPSTNPSDFTVYVKEIATGQVAAVRYPDPGVKQFGMTWQYSSPIIAPNIPLSLSDQKLISPKPLGGFGGSIDISGNTAIVGIPAESYDINKDGILDCNFGVGLECFLGAAYILEQNTQGIWNIMARIDNPVLPEILDHPKGFAGMVAISGDVAAIGYPEDYYDANGNGFIDCIRYTSNPKHTSECSQGRVYVFSRNQGGANKWGLIKTLSAVDSNSINPSRSFGVSIDFEGSTLVIGTSPLAYDTNGDDQVTCPSVLSECVVGRAYIFSQNQGGTNNWGLVKQLNAPTLNINDYFGRELSLSGDHLVVASPFRSTPSGFLQPAFYIYSRNQGGANNWGLIKELTIDNITNLSDSFLTSTALDNGTVVISHNTDKPSKNIYVFSQNQGGTNNWGRVKKVRLDQPGIEARLIFSVNALGDTIAVSALDEAYDANQNGTIECLDDFGVECSLGAVYFLSRNQGGTNNWGISKILGARDALTAGPETRFGAPVALSNTTIMVGASYDAENGAVYIFKP